VGWGMAEAFKLFQINILAGIHKFIADFLISQITLTFDVEFNHQNDLNLDLKFR